MVVDFKEIKDDFELLLKKGNIAFYNSAEITNIFLTQESDNPINVYSLVVFEEKGISEDDKIRKFVTKNLIPIDGRSLGISQQRIDLKEAETVFNDLLNDNNIMENKF